MKMKNQELTTLINALEIIKEFKNIVPFQKRLSFNKIKRSST